MSIKFTTFVKIYLQAAAFRAKHGLKVAVSKDGNVRADIVQHDYLHWISGLTASRKDEATITRLEEYLTEYAWADQNEIFELGNSVAMRYCIATSPEAEAVYNRLYKFLQF